MKERIIKLWKAFTPYEKIWFFSVIVLTILVAIFFPSSGVITTAPPGAERKERSAWYPSCPCWP